MARQQGRAGVALDLPEGAKIVPCPDCGELFFAVEMSDGGEVLVQPIVVRGVIPDRELVQLRNPPPPEEVIQKLVARTATGKLSSPIMVPHALVCITAPLVRSLPAPTKLVAMGPEPKPEPAEDPTKPPPGHVPVVHDLEIQNGKIGTSSKIPGEQEGEEN